LASILFASARFGGGLSAGAYQQIVKNMQKKIISIHKPPARENLKGSTVTARACLLGANLIDAGGL
jgi:hypothetical protein